MLVDRALPGLAPTAATIRFQVLPDGTVHLQVWEGVDLAFLRLDQADSYGPLTPGEALDVLSAVVDGWGLLEQP